MDVFELMQIAMGREYRHRFGKKIKPGAPAGSGRREHACMSNGGHG